MKATSHPLVLFLDGVIATHGDSNPELKQQLLLHRADLVKALESHQKKLAIRTALQIASWVKFIFDHL
jgi:hypothetical protein